MILIPSLIELPVETMSKASLVPYILSRDAGQGVFQHSFSRWALSFIFSFLSPIRGTRRHFFHHCTLSSTNVTYSSRTTTLTCPPQKVVERDTYGLPIKFEVRSVRGIVNLYYF